MTAVSLKMGGRSIDLSWTMIAAAASIILIAVLWRDALVDLWARWGAQQELSHSYFIPLISAWLVWTNRETVRKSVGSPAWIGAGLIGLALVMLLVGQLTFAFILQQIGLVVAIAGVVAAFGGLSLLRTTLAPVVFLLADVPTPHWLINVLSWKFQEWSSLLGVAAVKLVGIPVFLQGNIIDLGTYQLMVAEACSGLRYLFPFLCLGVMAAYMYRGPLWHKAVIVAMTVPITIVMNSVRIAFTSIMVHYFGIEQAQGFTHFFEGWVVFLLCLAALFLVVVVLTRFFARPRVSALQALTQPELPLTPPSKGGAKVAPLLGVIAAAAVAFVAIAQSINIGTLIIPEKKAFAGVVEDFQGWRTEVRPIEPEIAEVLAADDSIVVDMQSPEGKAYNLYMAYLNSRRDGRSWHSPRQCIPGGGWQITSHTVRQEAFDNGKRINFNRLVIENGSQRQLVYYWYDQRGRRIANEFVQKFWVVVDSVIRKRKEGEMVRLIVPVPEGASLDEADKSLVAYMDKVQRFLPAYVPE